MKLTEAEKQQRGAAFAAAREAAGLNQSELARALNVSPQAVQQYETGETTPRGHRLKTLRRLLGKAIDEIYLGSTSTQDTPGNYGVMQNLIPLLQWEDAHLGGSPAATESAISMRPDIGAGPRAFALTVVGDSMSAPPLPISSGAIITVDPDLSFESVTGPNNPLVVAEVDGDILLRRVTRDGTKWLLEANKPGYPIIPLTPACRVLGVVRRVTFDF